MNALMFKQDLDNYSDADIQTLARFYKINANPKDLRWLIALRHANKRQMLPVDDYTQPRILEKMDITSLTKMCSTNHYYKDLCETELKRRYEKVFKEIALAEDAYKNSQVYPFTDNYYVNQVLTSWASEFDEDEDGNEIPMPIPKKTLYKFYFANENTLINFILEHQLGLGEANLEKYIANEPTVANKIPIIQDMIKNIYSVDKWSLVYLILEIENFIDIDGKLYPRRIFSLVNE